MQSRYGMFQDSVTSDPIDNEVYPDTLSVDFTDFTYREPPYIVAVSDTLMTKPYIYTEKFYGASYYDDIIFNINGVNHISLIEGKGTINFPVQSDLNYFLTKKI